MDCGPDIEIMFALQKICILSERVLTVTDIVHSSIRANTSSFKYFVWLRQIYFQSNLL